MNWATERADKEKAASGAEWADGVADREDREAEREHQLKLADKRAEEADLEAKIALREKEIELQIDRETKGKSGSQVVMIASLAGHLAHLPADLRSSITKQMIWTRGFQCSKANAKGLVLPIWKRGHISWVYSQENIVKSYSHTMKN